MGKFDGIHIGHRRLLEEILYQKSKGLAACVFTFDPSPAALFGQAEEKALTTREEKRLLFERMGVDILVEFPLTQETAAMPPKVFGEDVLARRMQACFIAAGKDVTFGAGGLGGGALLERMGERLGYAVKLIDKVCLEGREVSSSRVREQVEAGRMELAQRLLGMPYLVAGKVAQGNRLGRTLGFPTLNLLPPSQKLLPPRGVYFSKVRCGAGQYRGVTNVGCKPTVSSDSAAGVETYLYDFDREVYGEDVEVYLLAFRRPERKFADLDALRAALKEDAAAGAAWG